MPSFAHLTNEEMTDLIAYLQTLGRDRKLPEWIVPPQEVRDHYALIAEAVDVNSSAAANAGRGIFQQNCAICHGVNGQGNGPVSTTMMKKPANFHRPFYQAYSNSMWYWRIAEGVPGTRMPRWNKALSDEDMLYLVAYLKSLPKDMSTGTNQYEVTEFSQINDANDLSKNFYEIEGLNHESPYYYGKGRSE
jgi:mono/diheme cytochrome c family protein